MMTVYQFPRGSSFPPLIFSLHIHGDPTLSEIDFDRVINLREISYQTSHEINFEVKKIKLNHVCRTHVNSET